MSVLDEEYFDALHQDDYKIQEAMVDPISFLATSKKGGDPDKIYYHRAMVAPEN